MCSAAAALSLAGYGFYTPAFALADHGGDLDQVPGIVKNGALGAFIDAMYGAVSQELPNAFLRFVQTNADLKKGDRVVTSSGIIGTVWGIKDNVVVLKVDDDVKMEFLKSAVSAKTE